MIENNIVESGLTEFPDTKIRKITQYIKRFCV